MSDSLFNHVSRFNQTGPHTSPIQLFKEGLRDGTPIGLGYFAVAFALGITAKNAGLSAFQGLLASVLNNASAGEYAGITLIASQGTYLEMALITLITNARYLLMSCALSQKFSPHTPFYHRLLVGFDVTDELFGLAIARPGYIQPSYLYGAFSVAIPCWGIGTSLGILAGSTLPIRVVSALSVALYGMFLAVIIPPARKNKVVALLVLLSFIASFASLYCPLLKELSSGTLTILLTVVLSGLAAICFPIPLEEELTQDEK